jgi:hypothetical protein
MDMTVRTTERGGARLKFLVVAVILGALAYAGYQYIPVAYQAYQYKDLMQQRVDAAAALGHPPGWVKDQLSKSALDYNVPADAEIVPVKEGDRVQVRVKFSRPIEFPGYVYQYEFDHTAKSTEFSFK